MSLQLRLYERTIIRTENVCKLRNMIRRHNAAANERRQYLIEVESSGWKRGELKWREQGIIFEWKVRVEG